MKLRNFLSHSWNKWSRSPTSASIWSTNLTETQYLISGRCSLERWSEGSFYVLRKRAFAQQLDRMRQLRDVIALLVCNSDKRERMAMLLVCITLVVVVSSDEQSTFELKHFLHLSCYATGIMTQSNPGLQPDHPKQCRQFFVTQLRPYC